MKKLMLIAALATTGALAACNDPAPRADEETLEPTFEAPIAPPIEEAPPVETAPQPAPPPVDSLPPDSRTSEQTVQPESETLFY